MSQDFELHFAPDGEGLRLTARSPTLPAAGKDFPRPIPPLDEEKITRLRQDQASTSQVRELQRQLGSWLLGHDLLYALQAALATPGAPLRLVFSYDTAVLPAVGEIPFELMEYNNAPLALDPRVASFVHVLPKVGATPAAVDQPWPLRVLLVRSNPQDLGNVVPPSAPLRDSWLALARQKAAQLSQASETLIQVDWLSREPGALAPPTWTHVRQQLQSTRYHILVYLGHGDLKTFADLDAGALLLESKDGATNTPVYAPQLQVALQNYPAPVVLLTGCLTGAQLPVELKAAVMDAAPEWMRGSQGVAQALVNSHSGVQVAVGMRSLLSTLAAETFLNAFFRSLLLGQQPGHVEAAVRAARMELYLEYPQSPGWSAPVLFHAPLAEPLFPFLAQPSPVSTTPAPPLPPPVTTPARPTTTTPPTGINTKDLLEKLLERTSTDDLRDICFLMSIDDEQFDTSTKPRFARALLTWLQQSGRL